ncbi:uncharacterized protein LOC142803295 [Rhipicephalus microplus]|uniref:uncharacterized protein LOC142803295 n=1 Tax=Rhipicephalus microplus TaxID=6941 RepID=UPI003F6A5935
MVSRIRNAFVKEMNSSSWVSRDIAADAINSLNGITAYVGSAGRRLEAEFVEAIYKPYPDVPLDRYFPTWIKALSHSAHYFWIDKATPLYRETRPTLITHRAKKRLEYQQALCVVLLCIFMGHYPSIMVALEW